MTSKRLLPVIRFSPLPLRGLIQPLDKLLGGSEVPAHCGATDRLVTFARVGACSPIILDRLQFGIAEAVEGDIPVGIAQPQSLFSQDNSPFASHAVFQFRLTDPVCKG